MLCCIYRRARTTLRRIRSWACRSGQSRCFKRRGPLGRDNSTPGAFGSWGRRFAGSTPSHVVRSGWEIMEERAFNREHTRRVPIGGLVFGI